jgi:tRNA (cmo5U34)-methyltransferase
MTDGQDRLFADRGRHLVDFAFGEDVAAVFPDMIRRSVPGYETVVPLTGLIAARYLARAGTGRPTAYDLGCSLGASTRAILDRLGDAPAAIIAVDNAPAMLARARMAIADPRVRFVEADIRVLEFEPAAVVVLNYVLQFVAPEDRVALLERIRAALEPDGIMIVSEKICDEDPDTQALFDTLHLDFKRANGYSELEISGKRSALEHVMIVDSDETHRTRFAAAGFGSVRLWYRCLNWASFLVGP